MQDDSHDQFRPRMPERVRKTSTQYSASCDKIPSAPPKKLTMLQQDAGLVTELAQKLKTAEQENDNLRILLRRANEQNVELEKEVFEYESAQFKESGVEFEIERLKQYGEELEQEIFAMEEFLDQHGLVYVESDFGKEQANQMITAAVQELEQEEWKAPAMEVLKVKVESLNRRFRSKEFVTDDGITSHEDNKGLQIIFFEDGIFIKRGPFRAYACDATAVQFTKDIIDGFVPSELESAFPDGICFDAVFEDNKFVEKSVQRFEGGAKTVDGGSCVANPDEEELDQLRANYEKISGYKKENYVQFNDEKSTQLNSIPVEVVLSKISNKEIITGQVVKKEDVSLEKTMLVDRSVEDKETATLRLISNRGQRVLLKLPFDAQVSLVYELVAEQLELSIGSFIIQRALGGEIPGGLTLQEAGLVPNCRLMIRIGV